MKMALTPVLNHPFFVNNTFLSTISKKQCKSNPLICYLVLWTPQREVIFIQGAIWKSSRNHQGRRYGQTHEHLSSRLSSAMFQRNIQYNNVFTYLLQSRTGSGSEVCSLYCSSPGWSQPSHSMSSTEQRQSEHIMSDGNEKLLAEK